MKVKKNSGWLKEQLQLKIHETDYGKSLLKKQSPEKQKG